MMEQVLPPAVLALFALAAAWSDVRQRRISNLLSLACALAGLAIALWLGGLAGLGWHAAHMVVALVIGMVLFAIKVVGGGDAKFYAAVAAFFPLQQGLALGATIAILGGVLLVVFIIWRRVLRRGTQAKGNFAKLPYGVAIGAGAVALSLVPFA